MKNNHKVFRVIPFIMQFGINMIVPILMCTMIGVWLGKKFDIPFIIVPLFIIGALAGATNIYKMVRKIYKQDGDSGKKYV